MKKINIQLTPEDLASILHIVDQKEKGVQQISSNKNIPLGITGKLISNLTDSQKEQTINAQVKGAIFRSIGIPLNQIADGNNLTLDLHMESAQIRLLSIPFSDIACHYKPGIVISSDECELQNTVQDCVNLILGKIN
ncbi:MAG: hypothetical protein M3Z26_13570 [Bacteroidota bacterium]|nr:hypothetical protein [Bacteroidota bacterium]